MSVFSSINSRNCYVIMYAHHLMQPLTQWEMVMMVIIIPAWVEQVPHLRGTSTWLHDIEYPLLHHQFESIVRLSFECHKSILLTWGLRHNACVVIGLENVRHFLIQSEVKPKAIVKHSRTFTWPGYIYKLQMHYLQISLKDEYKSFCS